VGALALSAQAQQTQPFSTPNIYGFGDPLEAIKGEAALGFTADLATFGEGQATFIEVDGLPELGPLFNSQSCGTCHSPTGARRNGILHQRDPRRNSRAPDRCRSSPATTFCAPGRRARI
jgi:hypothetical protein